MAPHPISLPCALALPSSSHRDAATPSPCWASRFMTQQRLMLSNPTPSEPHLSPAATMSDDMLLAIIPLSPCASILQPATPPQVVAFESCTISAPFSLLLNHGNPIFEPACMFYDFLCCLWFLTEITFSFRSLLTIRSFSSQWFHYYFNRSVVSWQYQKYYTILILVLCFFCEAVGLLILLKLCPVFTFLQQLITKGL